MKKIFTFLLLGISFSGFSQDINLRLDDTEWQQGSCGSGLPNYEDPTPTNYWTTLNNLCSLGNSIVTVKKTTDAYLGTAAKLRSDILGIANADSTPGLFARLIPGLINSGTLDPGNFTSPLQQGKPYSGRPSCFQGYYKYLPVFGDSAAIYARLTKGGATVGEASMVVKTTVNSYTMFQIPFTYLNNDTPDSINIVLTSSAGSETNAGRKGSTLYIDEVAVLMTCSQSSFMPVSIFSEVFPNPATDKLNVRLHENIAFAKMEIFNLTGQKTGTYNLNHSNTEINTADFPEGLYFYRLENESGKIQTGNISVTK